MVCYTGGWGSPRVLPYLDYDLIARKPKVLIGYSDITALLNAVHKKTGLITFHGPVGGSTVDPFTLHIDRMLTTLVLGGLFEKAAGIIFGRCSDCGVKGPSLSLEEILGDRFGSLPIPAISGLSFGHIELKLVLPIGARATLYADAGTVRVEEGGRWVRSWTVSHSIETLKQKFPEASSNNVAKRDRQRHPAPKATIKSDAESAEVGSARRPISSQLTVRNLLATLPALIPSIHPVGTHGVGLRHDTVIGDFDRLSRSVSADCERIAL